MSESIRKLNENPVTALADTDYIVACDSAGNLSPIKKADFIAGIQVGGRNLVKENGSTRSPSGYRVATFDFGEDKPKQDDIITISVWGDFSSINYLRVWNSSDRIMVSSLLKINDGLLRHTMKWIMSNSSETLPESTHVCLYKDSPAITDNVTIDRIMVERGSVAHDWTPAPEDILDRLTALENRGGGNRFTPNYLQSARERRAA